MSTNISDLPGPLPSDNDHVDVDIEVDNQINSENHNNHNNHNNYSNHNNEFIGEYEMEYEQNNDGESKRDNTNIYENIKKLNKRGLLENIKKQFNEKNLILFVIIFLASLPLISNYVINFINMLPFKNSIPKSNLTVSFIKSLFLIILYIFVKKQIK